MAHVIIVAGQPLVAQEPQSVKVEWPVVKAPGA